MGNQYSSLKNETVIFIIPHTINTITIHVFKILSSIIPNYVQNSFDCNGVSVAILISILIFWFSPPSAAPIATPTAIHTGSFVAAKTADPIAVPTPIQFPALLEFLVFFNLTKWG